MSFIRHGHAGGIASPTRRRFIQGIAAAGAVSALGFWPKPGWALRSRSAGRCGDQGAAVNCRAGPAWVLSAAMRRSPGRRRPGTAGPG